MEKYRRLWASKSNASPSNQEPPNDDEGNAGTARAALEMVLINSSAKPVCTEEKEEEVDLSALPTDPARRKPISQYKPAKVRDDVRRAYLQKGPFQPDNHNFPQTYMSGIMRRFKSAWFKEYNWLEYSIEEDAAYCLPCYLFQTDRRGSGGGDTFSAKGWRTWNNLKRLDVHIGEPSSSHNQNVKRCADLMNQKQSIAAAIRKQTKKSMRDYKARLIVSIDIARLLLCLGLPFRGHDESESSIRKGNFLTFYEWYAARCPEVGAITLGNAPKNLKLNSPTIQKEIVQACARETLRAIREDIGDEYFAILVDESRDVSHKEQMALVIRYVDKRGFVMERLVGVSHVSQTTSLALKQAIYDVLTYLQLSPSQIRGQGYDGASNMQGHLNGLKTLVMQDSKAAHSIHCFAHQLQLTLVAVSKNHEDVVWIFEWMSVILSTIGGSFKNRDLLREKLAAEIEEALQMGELETGRGLNQELGLKRPGDTRWGSHFGSLMNMIIMFASVVKVIDAIAEFGSNASDRLKAKGVLDVIQTFDFALMLHLMKVILGITNELNVALQKKDQDIVNAVSYLGTTKRRLQEMRNEGWEGMFTLVVDFCLKHDIVLPDMHAMHVPRGSKSKRRAHTDGLTNENYYKSVMYAVIDLLQVELNGRFSETATTLLLGMGCLDPADSFSKFDKERILAMARLYPDDFQNESKLEELSCQLDNFVENFRDDSRFSNIKGIGDLCRKLVETKKHTTFPHVFLLLKLTLVLPVATATVERAFSAMKYIKSDLRNRIGDGFLYDCMITYVEADVFRMISTDTIMCYYQAMHDRGGVLP
jgi:hypothetical protein